MLGIPEQRPRVRTAPRSGRAGWSPGSSSSLKTHSKEVEQEWGDRSPISRLMNPHQSTGQVTLHPGHSGTGQPTFGMLQHKEHGLFRDDVLVQTHHVGHAAGDDGLPVPAALAALPQTLTENKKVSCTRGCLWSLLCSVFINHANLSELLGLQRDHSSALCAPSVPGGSADGIWRESRQQKMPQSCH